MSLFLLNLDGEVREVKQTWSLICWIIIGIRDFPNHLNQFSDCLFVVYHEYFFL